MCNSCTISSDLLGQLNQSLAAYAYGQVMSWRYTLLRVLGLRMKHKSTCMCECTHRTKQHNDARP
jgi:hypothetical protein